MYQNTWLFWFMQIHCAVGGGYGWINRTEEQVTLYAGAYYKEYLPNGSSSPIGSH